MCVDSSSCAFWNCFAYTLTASSLSIYTRSVGREGILGEREKCVKDKLVGRQTHMRLWLDFFIMVFVTLKWSKVCHTERTHHWELWIFRVTSHCSPGLSWYWKINEYIQRQSIDEIMKRLSVYCLVSKSQNECAWLTDIHCSNSIT